MKKILFNAWLEDYKETRQAKRWFKRNKAGRGGDESGDEDGEWYWPEREDLISLLPKDVSIKVSRVVIRKSVLTLIIAHVVV